MPVQVLAIGAAQAVAGADRTLPDANGHCRRRYGVPADGGAYLLRPDQHVCARWRGFDDALVRAAVARATCNA